MLSAGVHQAWVAKSRVCFDAEQGGTAAVEAALVQRAAASGIRLGDDRPGEGGQRRREGGRKLRAQGCQYEKL